MNNIQFYLDYAASTPVDLDVLDVYIKSLKKDYYNPSANYRVAKNLMSKINKIRDSFLELLSAPKSSQIIFTSSATESNNIVINSFVNKTILFNPIDHPSMINPVRANCKTNIEMKNNSDSSLDEEFLYKTIKNIQIKMVLLTHVNSQTGHVLDIERIVSKIKSINEDIWIHVDCVQSFSKLKVNSSCIDSLTISGHKIGTPKGISLLLLKKPEGIKPLIFGGGQEFNLRSSTVNYPLIKAIHFASIKNFKNIDLRLKKARLFKEKLILALNTKIPNKISFPFKNTSPYIISFFIKDISSDILLRVLEEKGVIVSSSSACSSKIKGENKILTSLNIPVKKHKELIRVSHFSNLTEDEENIVIKLLTTEINNLYSY